LPLDVIISDEAIQYDTCSGMSWKDGTKRVFSTRANGMITLNADGTDCTLDCVSG
jgi:hypothetical protein